MCTRIIIVIITWPKWSSEILDQESNEFASTGRNSSTEVLGNVPEWIRFGKIDLIMKDSAKGRQPGNYRPITCLTLMWKILTGILADKDVIGEEQNSISGDQAVPKITSCGTGQYCMTRKQEV